MSVVCISAASQMFLKCVKTRLIMSYKDLIVLFVFILVLQHTTYSPQNSNNLISDEVILRCAHPHTQPYR